MPLTDKQKAILKEKIVPTIKNIKIQLQKNKVTPTLFPSLIDNFIDELLQPKPPSSNHHSSILDTLTHQNRIKRMFRQASTTLKDWCQLSATNKNTLDQLNTDYDQNDLSEAIRAIAREEVGNVHESKNLTLLFGNTGNPQELLQIQQAIGAQIGNQPFKALAFDPRRLFYKFNSDEQIYFQQAQALGLQKGTLENPEILDHQLLVFISEYAALSQKSAKKALRHQCNEIRKFCRESRQGDISRSETLFLILSELEYTLRDYLHHHDESHPPEVKKAIKYTFYIIIMELLEKLAKEFPDYHYAIDISALRPPLLSVYACPFINDPELTDSYVMFNDDLVITQNSSTEMLMELLDYLKNPNPAHQELYLENLYLMLKMLHRRDKFVVIQRLATGDENYFKLIMDKIAIELNLYEELKTYQRLQRKSEILICYVAILKHIHYKNSEAIHSNKNINKIEEHEKYLRVALKICLQATQHTFGGLLDRNSLSADLLYYADYIYQSLLAHSQYFLNKANTALITNRGYEIYFTQAISTESSITQWPCFPQTAARHTTFLTKLETFKTQSTLKVQAAVFAAQQFIPAPIKKQPSASEITDVTIYESDHEDDPSDNELPAIVALESVPDKLLREAGEAMRTKQIALAETKLSLLSDLALSPMQVIQVLADYAEIYLSKGMQMTHTIKLMSHLLKPYKPISNEELEDIQCVRAFYAEAERYCTQALRKSLANEKIIAVDMILQQIKTKQFILEHKIADFLQKSLYRETIIKLHKKWAIRNTGYARSINLLKRLPRPFTQHLENPTYHPQDFRLPPDLIELLSRFLTPTQSLILYGGTLRNLARQSMTHKKMPVTDIDIFILAPNVAALESFLQKTVDSYHKNPYREHQYRAHFMQYQFDITFKPSTCDPQDVQAEIEQDTDFNANGMSIYMTQDTIHPLYSKGNAYNEAVNGIINTENFDQKLKEDPCRFFRYLRFSLTGQFIFPDFFLTLNDLFKRDYMMLLQKRCQEKGEFGRLRSELTKLCSLGNTNTVLQAFISFMFLSVCFEKTYLLFSHHQFEIWFCQQFQELSYVAKPHLSEHLFVLLTVGHGLELMQQKKYQHHYEIARDVIDNAIKPYFSGNLSESFITQQIVGYLNHFSHHFYAKKLLTLFPPPPTQAPTIPHLIAQAEASPSRQASLSVRVLK